MYIPKPINISTEAIRNRWNDAQAVYKGLRYLEDHDGRIRDMEVIPGITDAFWGSMDAADAAKELYSNPEARKTFEENYFAVGASLKRKPSVDESDDGLGPDGQQINIVKIMEKRHEQPVEVGNETSMAVDPNSRPQFKPTEPNPVVEESKQPATEPKQDVERSERVVEEDGTDASLDRVFAYIPIKWLSLDLTKQELKVLVALASWAKGKHRYPDAKTIAARAGMGYRKVYEVLKSLRVKGIIGMEKKLHPKSKSTLVTHYEIKVW